MTDLQRAQFALEQATRTLASVATLPPPNDMRVEDFYTDAAQTTYAEAEKNWNAAVREFRTQAREARKAAKA